MTSLSDLLTVPTAEQKKADLLARLAAKEFPVTDWEEGGVARTLIEIEAAELSMLHGTQAQIAASGLLSRAYGPWATLVAKEVYGVDRYPATYAQGPLQLSCLASGGPVTITPGQLWVSDGDGHRYTNVTGGVLPSGGTLSVTIKAESPGSAYNVVPGVISRMITVIPGVTCTNPSLTGSWPTVQGTNEESDYLLKQRCQDQWSTLGYGQNADWYRYYARNKHQYAESVTRVLVQTNPDGIPGLVRVTLAGPSGTVSSPVVAAVQASFDAKRASSVTVEVAAANEEHVLVTATSRVLANFSDTYRAAALKELQSLFESFAIGSTIYRAGLVEALMIPPGALDTTIALPAMDELVLPATTVPVLGTFTSTIIPQ